MFRKNTCIITSETDDLISAETRIDNRSEWVVTVNVPETSTAQVGIARQYVEGLRGVVQFPEIFIAESEQSSIRRVPAHLSEAVDFMIIQTVSTGK